VDRSVLRRLAAIATTVVIVGATGVAPAADLPALPTPEPESRGEPNHEAGSEVAAEAEEAFNPNRRLCPDEACIGVVGSDNKCSVCGRRG